MSEIVIQHFPKVHGKRNREILRIVSSVLTEYGKIEQKELDLIKNQLRGNDRHIPLLTYRRLAHVLSLLKDWYGINTIIPAVPIPPPRNSILPETASEFSCLDGVYSMINIFWKSWLVHSMVTGCKNTADHDESLIFAFAFSLATDASLNSIQITDILTQLRWDDIDHHDRYIKVKVHPNDYLNRYSILHLPIPSLLILQKLAHEQVRETGCPHLLYPAINPKLKNKKAKINRILRKKYLDFYKYVQSSVNIPCPISWSAFTDISHMINFDKGLEPFIISAFRRYPFPVSHPVDSKLRMIGKRMSHHVPPQLISPALGKVPIKHVSFRSIEFKKTIKSKSKEDDWCGKSKTVLRRLIVNLKRITKKKIKSDIQVTKARDLIADAIKNADEIAPGKKSALHLALYWIRDYISEKRSISASTVNDYFTRAFYTGLLTL